MTTAISTRLDEIKNKLTALKKDRSKYLKSSDVKAIYSDLTDVVQQVIQQHQTDKETVDKLEDVFQLMSLALLTVGLKNTAPACYASLTTVKRLLDHLGADIENAQNAHESHNQSATFTESDVQAVNNRLQEIERILQEARDGEESSAVVTLVEMKLNKCKKGLERIKQSMARIDPALQPTFEKLVYIRREILSVGSTPNTFSSSSFNKLRESLRQIESERVDGQFVNENGQLYAGQQQLNNVIEECHDLMDDFSAMEDRVDSSLKPMYKELVDLKNVLEGLVITHRWTLRETDLYGYQIKLQAADSQLKEITENSEEPLYGVSILLYLMRRSYALIYKLLESSEPISEALQPLHNQLTTARRCLLDVKKMGGLSNIRELYPYQMKLASIDNLRVDGKFMVGDGIPEGQGMLNALLNECFDIIYELKVELGEKNYSSEANSEDERESVEKD